MDGATIMSNVRNGNYFSLQGPDNIIAMMPATNGHSARSYSEKEAWDHFCKVLKLEKAQRKLLKGQEVKSTGDYYALGDIKGIQADTPTDKAAKALFDFDTANVPVIFGAVKRANLILAWIWLDAHADAVDDANLFCNQFKDTFKSESRATKQQRLVALPNNDPENLHSPRDSPLPEVHDPVGGQETERCHHCGVGEDSQAPLQHCGGCRLVLYCSTACQNADRNAHKKICKINLSWI
jgi:hypothetical protein